MTRGVRIIHLALVIGLVLVAGVFYIVRQRPGVSFGFRQPAGLIMAGIALVNLVIALGFLAPRVPQRPVDQSADDYWTRNEIRGAAIILWAMVEAAAVLAWLGYLMTGAWVPAAVGLLAIAALTLLRPARLEGS